jgi:endonuclease/exonuclease/phosphatase family metal-dependent hydrolase
VRVRVADGGRDLSFVTTHLHHFDAEFRAQQAARINEVLGAVDRPVILAGDLNATPDSPPIRILRRAWSLDASDPARPTYPAEGPDKRIDYILFRPASRFRLVEQSVLDEEVASDHRAVLAVLEFLPE